MADPYCWPGEDCLQNRLGIHDARQLEEIEGRFAGLRDAQIAAETLPGEYDLAHLKRFHHFLFRDIYSWAGETRTVQLSKGPVPFCHPQFLEEQTSLALAGLAADDYLRGLRKTSFVPALAKHYGEINACHPFREGNGRMQRSFFRQVAAAAGWRIDWSELNRADNIEASSRSLVAGDTDALEILFGSIIYQV